MSLAKLKITTEILDSKESLYSFANFLKDNGMVKSTSEAVRLIKEGAVTVYYKEEE